MAPPVQPWAARNLRRGQLQQEGGWKRTGGIHPPARSASFHGKTTSTADLQRHHQIMRRPKTQPDLLAAAAAAGGGDCAGHGIIRLPVPAPVPAKVVVNVNVQRSLGAVQVMASTDWTVDQLIAASVKQYVKEGRRPPLPTTDPSACGLHYSQFSLQCLDPKEKLIGLGSRNFFLCPKPTTTASAPTKSSSSSETLPAASSSCSKEADKASKMAIPWLRFMDFLF